MTDNDNVDNSHSREGEYDTTETVPPSGFNFPDVDAVSEASRPDVPNAAELAADNEGRLARLREAMDKEASLGEDEARAIASLRAIGRGAELQKEYVSVDIGNGVTVDVCLSPGARVEDAMDRLAEIGSRTSSGEMVKYAEVRSVAVDVLTGLIDRGPYSNPTVWEAYASEFGTAALFEMVNHVTDEMQEASERKAKATEKFRPDQTGATTVPSYDRFGNSGE